MTTTTPRPPEGDWLGTPYLRFTREGPFGVCTLDRPEARNAMTPAMYFGIRYAVRHVDADPDLAGLLITGTGDVFAPGGDMGGGDGSDNWLTFGSALGMDVTPFETLRQSVKPVVSAVNGLCQGGGLQIALCSDMTVVSDRATFRVPELFRGIADTYYSQMLARLIGPVRTRDLMFTGRTLTAQEAAEWGMVARVVPHDELLDDGPRGARPVLPDRAGGAQRGQVQPGQLHGSVRPHRHAGQLLVTGSQQYVAGLHADPVEQAHVVVEAGLDHAPAPGAVRQHWASTSRALVHQLVVRDDAGDHAPVDGLLGGQRAAGEHQVAGADGTDQPRQHVAVVGVGDAAVELGHPERRAVADHCHVAAHRDLQAAALARAR